MLPAVFGEPYWLCVCVVFFFSGGLKLNMIVFHTKKALFNTISYHFI